MAKRDYKRADYYSRKAREKGFPARSVFKLEEIDRKEKLIRPGMRVLDLGASPGSWMKYAAGKVGPRGLVVGVDRKPLARELLPNERFILADVFELAAEKLRAHADFYDLALSDLMPETIGHKTTDHYRSVAAAERAWELARELLREGGHFLVKVFQGPDFDSFRNLLRAHFRAVKVKKPGSSRPGSRETYLLALSRRVVEETGKEE